MATVALLILLLAAPAVYAAEHTVGGSSGWNSFGDYTTWAAGQTFTVGDTLLFNYDSTHKVDVVNQADYANCATGNAIETHSPGPTTITLSTAGPMYFICPTSGHCTQGMKLAITVLATSGGTPSTPPSVPSSPTGTPPSPTSTAVSPPPPPPPSNGATCNFCKMNHLVLGLSLVLAAVLAFMG